MKIVFFGTSSFAAHILRYLIQENVEILAIVTRPDRPRGRSLHASAPPVKELALSLPLDIPVYQPEKASTEEFAKVLKTLDPDLFVVVAYGEIIKKNLLDIPKKGCINSHASILPKYRGAAPMQRCLMEGAKETGITIIKMAEQMDAGDIIKIAKTSIQEGMTLGELEDKLRALSCPLLMEVLRAFEQGPVKGLPQDHSQATFAPKITPEEEMIDWNQPAEKLLCLICALSPFPGAWCSLRVGNEQKRLKIKRAKLVEALSGNPGEILAFGKEGW
ncbi:MAG: methionyl-tRNA formyltransferase, partial [Anaerolineae bacterium]